MRAAVVRLGAGRIGAAMFLLALAGACGERRQATRSIPGGPPRWRSATDERWHEGPVATIEARSACRVAIRYEGSQGMPDPAPRPLAAGATVRVFWAVDLVGPERSRSVPPADEEAAGRTEPHEMVIRFAYDDEAVGVRRATVWTRPGKGRRLRVLASVPAPGEDLAIGSRRTLATAAVVDVLEGTATLEERDGDARLRTPQPPGEGDLAVVSRLSIEILPP